MTAWSFMAKFLIVFGLLASAIPAAASENCFSKSTFNVVQFLKEGMAQKNLWTGFDPSSVQIAIKATEENSLFLLQVEASAFSAAQVEYQECPEDSALKKISISSNFPALANGIFTFVFPGDLENEAISAISSASKQPVIIISIAQSPHLPTIKEKDFARILTHESFHMVHQFFGGFSKMTDAQNHPRDFYKDCLKDMHWNFAHAKEMLLVEKIRKNWTRISEAGLKNIVLQIIQIHSQFKTGSKAFFCSEHSGFWERLEGTAHYIDIETALNLGLFHEIPASETRDGSADSFFYKTGGTYSLILKRLYPAADWQKRINEGENPFQVLKKLTTL